MSVNLFLLVCLSDRQCLYIEYVTVSVCISVTVPLCLSISMYICVSVFLCFSVFVRLYISVSVCMGIHMFYEEKKRKNMAETTKH